MTSYLFYLFQINIRGYKILELYYNSYSSLSVFKNFSVFTLIIKLDMNVHHSNISFRYFNSVPLLKL